MPHHHFSESGGDNARCEGCGISFADAVAQPRPCRPIRKAF